MVTPRYFVRWTHWRGRPLMVYDGRGWLFWQLKMITFSSVKGYLPFSWPVKNWIYVCLEAFFFFAVYLIVSYNISLSSTYKLTLLNMDRGELFMYIINSVERNTNPCGTPDSTECVDDFKFLLTTTFWLRSSEISGSSSLYISSLLYLQYFGFC